MAPTMTPEQYAELLAAERKLTDLANIIPKAEECGIECQNYRAAQQTQLRIIAALKKNFSPTGV
jgi:hypothetical protein